MTAFDNSNNGCSGIQVPMSPGELVDRVSILSIKLERILDPQKLATIRESYRIHCEIMDDQGIGRDQSLFHRIREINLELWRLENAIREKECAKQFDEEFIRIARNIYLRNDARAALKRAIDSEYGAEVAEVKEYAGY